MDPAKTSNPFTMPEPSITPYDPVYYPTQPIPMFPDTTTFNFAGQTFNFNFAFPTIHNDAGPYSTNRPCMQEDVVPTHIESVFPEDINSMLNSLHFESVDFNHVPELPLPSTPRTEHPGSKPNNGFASKPPPEQKKVVPKKRRPRRGDLRLRYSSFDIRLATLEQDPFVLQIMQEENRVRCLCCKKYIQLDNRKAKSLHLQNWKTHKRRCAGRAQCRHYSLCLRRSTVSDLFFFFVSVLRKPVFQGSLWEPSSSLLYFTNCTLSISPVEIWFGKSCCLCERRSVL